MSFSFGGISLLPSWTSLYGWDDPFPARSGFRSFICALLFLAVVLILAYLTNPTETSFRAYLTERSFRQHLSHLEDLTDDSGPHIDYKSSRSVPSSSARSISSSDRITLPFHFANRASVSLRTPKHVLHSFGICTIATTRGCAGTADRRNGSTLDGVEHGAAVIPDIVFIGAFGRWWLGGTVDSWYFEAMVRSKDAEGWSSGILGFKASDKLSEYNGLLFSRSVSCSRLLQRGTPPKLRGREHTQVTGSLPRRNSTPPPLPKSASLPLHADHRTIDQLQVSSSHGFALGAEHKHNGSSPVAAHAISRTCSASGTPERSPAITEVQKQIVAAQTSVDELQVQLSDAQAAARQSQTQLQAELDGLRAKKREEDQKRADGRTRAKALEEARRLAEVKKRDADKKLKTARGTKESATRKVEKLENEIGKLKQRINQDRTVLAAGPANAEVEKEQRLLSELAVRKKEVRVAEEVVAALNARAKELEQKIVKSKERLRVAREAAALEARVQIESANTGYGQTTWTYNPFDLPADMIVTQEPKRHEPANPARSKTSARLSLGPLSGFGTSIDGPRDVVGSRARAHTLFGDDTTPFTRHGLQPLSTHSNHDHGTDLQTSTFSPFDAQTPSTAFIPSSLISMLDSPSGDWKGNFASDSGTLLSSPVSLGAPSSSELDTDSDSYEARILAQTQVPHVYDTPSMSTNSDPAVNTTIEQLGDSTTGTPRRWFSTSAKEKPRKGLNPDAQVFRLPRRKMQTCGADAGSNVIPDANMDANVSGSTPSLFDALNPTGRMAAFGSATPSRLLRAFAPSQAEREALQRALGGSTNTSLERLPSLSDVGSIPPSPIRVHGPGCVSRRARGGGGASEQLEEKEYALPAWLQSLPLIRKPNFSPWEDEEPVGSTGTKMT